MQKIRNISTTDIRWLWSGIGSKSIWHREKTIDFTNVRNVNRKWECQKAEEKSASPVQNAGQNLWKKVENKRRFFHCLVISISIKKNYRKKVKKYIRHITADSALLCHSLFWVSDRSADRAVWIGEHRDRVYLSAAPDEETDGLHQWGDRVCRRHETDPGIPESFRWLEGREILHEKRFWYARIRFMSAAYSVAQKGRCC